MEFYKNKTIEQMTATLAHEVKNPVALIKANIDYMELQDKSGIYEKNYEIIKKELNKISDIVMNYIKLSSPESVYDSELIFISDLISDVIDEFNTPYKDKNIIFELEECEEDLKFWGEYSKICIVFFNIYKNAIEAIKNNGNIKARIFKEGAYIVAEVSDNGGGMCDMTADTLMKPFFTTKKEGSGLGLSICKNIIEAHKGSFSIGNNECGGCTVTIKVPSA